MAASALWCLCNTEHLKVITKKENCENPGGGKAKHCKFDDATGTCVPRLGSASAGGGSGAGSGSGSGEQPMVPAGVPAGIGGCAFTTYWAKVNGECQSGAIAQTDVCEFAAKCASGGSSGASADLGASAR